MRPTPGGTHRNESEDDMARHERAMNLRLGHGRLVAVVCMVALAAVGVGAGVALGVGGGGGDPASQQKAEAAAAMDQAMQQARTKARSSGVKKPDPLAARPKPDPDPIPVGAGIVPVSPPVSAQQYLLDDTGWREVTGAKVKFVYAGAMPKNTSQGIVVAVTSTLPPADPPPDFKRQDQGVQMDFKVYPTPKQLGPVQIASAEGRTLSLATSDGKVRFRFDAGREKYVSG
jgi:hypothetical protein